jgi:hypothetical protein
MPPALAVQLTVVAACESAVKAAKLNPATSGRIFMDCAPF